MDIKDLREGMLVRDGHTLLKISTVYENHVAASVLLEGRPSKPPARTKVRRYAAYDVELYFDEPWDSQIRKMDEAYGGRPAFSSLIKGE